MPTEQSEGGMNLADARALGDVMLLTALGASEIVKGIYHREDREIAFKEGDDPVTLADREANAFIIEALSAVLPGVPIVAEESDPSTYAGYTNASAAFFVDPLDGTREFVAKNGEFCVMIGFAEAGRAAIGVVVATTWGKAYVGAPGHYAEVMEASGARSPIRVSSTNSLAESRALISRSHKSEATDRILARLGAKALVPYGSAGLKALHVATGQTDLYVHPGPSGMLWDSCAPEALVRAAGGTMTDARGKNFDYRRPTLANVDGVLASNAELHPLALAKLGSFP